MTNAGRPSLALIGCGRMGQALLAGWLKQKLDYNITVVQPSPLPPTFPQAGYNCIPKLNYKKTFDIIVFAVKPQILDEVAAGYVDAVHDASIVVSIAAGKKIATFERIFGDKQPVIRAMPNTPAAVGKGITAFSANNVTSQDACKTVSNLFTPCGETLWLATEQEMDAVTAISGSGPAYIFYFIESFTAAAESLGLSKEKAIKLARQTVIGAAALAESEADISAKTLRENVTSPGGTTQAALSILMDGSMDDILKHAVSAAKNRSRELSN